jgi:putative ABC transport system permease protein
MFRNYLRTALRAMYRDKWYSLVNIGGLAIGMCVALLLGLYVKFELSFDKFHDNYERIYRIHTHYQREGLEEMKNAVTVFSTGEALYNKIPEVESFARLYFGSTGNISIEDETYTPKQLTYTDTSFFKIFNFPIVLGDKIDPLGEPFKIVVTERIAKQWFGDENPIGKSIQTTTIDIDTITRAAFRRPQSLTISAVIKDVPKNSQLQFDILTNFKTLPINMLRGNAFDYFTYIKTRKEIDDPLRGRIAIINGEEVERLFGKTYGKEFIQTPIMPLAKVHLHSKYKFERALTGEYSFVLTLGIVALLVLIIASINFINLSTARADNRKREVGIRKTVGSSKPQIMIQFIGESILTSLLALTLSLMLIELLITPFNTLLKTSLSLDYKQNLGFFLFVIGVAIAVGVIGGLYPSLYVSRFKPITILRGLTETGKQNPFVKSALIVFQFGIAAILVFGLILINSQLRFMKNKDLGFDKDNIVLFFGITNELTKSYNTVQEDIKTIPGVISMSAAQSFPGAFHSGMNLSLEGSDPSMAISVSENRVQDYYVETMKMKIIKGRDFSPNSIADNDGYIINEAAAKILGLDDPIDARVMMWKRPGKIIGVIKDYHYASLKNNIEPLVISRYNPSMSNFTIRIEDFDKAETINRIAETIKKHDPNYKTNYYFLADYLKRMYGSEERTFKLILSSSILAILLSMIGLYALSAYSIANRTKELGVRKILGASLSTLLRLLLTDSTKWVLVANLIALPIGWYFAQDWLNDFAYRIDIKPWFFIAAIISNYLIALLTIVWQVLQAARTNPVNALRYE